MAKLPFPIRDVLGFCQGSPLGLSAYGGLMALGGYALGRPFVEIHQLPPVMDAYAPEIMDQVPDLEPFVEQLRAQPFPPPLSLVETVAAQATEKLGATVVLEPLSAGTLEALRAAPSATILALFPAEAAASTEGTTSQPGEGATP